MGSGQWGRLNLVLEFAAEGDFAEAAVVPGDFGAVEEDGESG